MVDEYSKEYSTQDDSLDDFEEQNQTYEEEPAKETEEILLNTVNANIPVYAAPEEEENLEFDLKEGDKVQHEQYGIGLITKIIGYGNKKLCSIQFDNVGKRLLDPTLAVLEKVQ